MRGFVCILGLGVTFVACNGEADVEPLPGIDFLGHETHSVDKVTLEVVANADDGLTRAMDMEFNPEVEGELWIVNATDDSVVIVHNATTAEATSEKIIDPFAMHFMDNVAALSFGAPGFFATAQESSNTYNGQGSPNYFMGPTLWPSSLDLFGQSNPEAIEYLSDLYGFYVDLGSHYDMLHDSPLATGIEWSHDNVYWVFDGYHDAISRQDFAEDHGMGWDDHNDGEILRYVSGEVKKLEGVHSGLALDAENGLLYIADTGNGRIAVLDINSGTMGARLPQVDERAYPVHNLMDDATITTLVDKLDKPSGLVLKDDLLYVVQNGSGRISAYDLSGNRIDYLDTGRDGGALQGLNFGPDGALYVADGKAKEVFRLKGNPDAFVEAE